MLPEVHQNVHERVAHRAGRGERPSVVSVAPHASPTAERAVDGLCDADGEAADSARERPPGVGLGDEMDVIVLHGKLNDPEIPARRRGQRVAHEREDARRAQAADGLQRPQRHVHGVESDVRRARAVRHAGPAAGGGLAPSAGASPAPRAGGRQGKLDQATRHDLIGRYYQSS